MATAVKERRRTAPPAQAAASDYGKKPELAWLPIGKLAVDPKYQRDTGSKRSRHLIAKIAADFKWSRFGIVSAVKQGATWFIVDGQHRVEACRVRGDISHVPAVVLPHATLAAAAADFVAINRDRVAVTPLHIHYACLAAGDADALAIDRVVTAAGIELCRYPVPGTSMKPRQTLAIGTIARIVALRGEAFAIQVLRDVVKAAGNEPGRCGATPIRLAAEARGMVAANRKAGALTAAKRRDCLRCGRSFISEGAGNRLCASCKTRSA